MTSKPKKVLSILVDGDHGHYRKIDQRETSPTYHIPPRTSIAGMLAAVAGLNRDSYYQTFSQENSHISITPVTDSESCQCGADKRQRFHTFTSQIQRLDTKNLKKIDEYNISTKDKSATVKLKMPDEDRQQQLDTKEYLWNPSYIIDFSIKDRDLYDSIKQKLKSSEAVYPPTLGLSQMLCTVEYRGELEVKWLEDSSNKTIDSTVPDGLNDIEIQAGTDYCIERSPSEMEEDGMYRKTTSFTDQVFSFNGNLTLTSPEEHNVAETEDKRTIVFS